MKASRVAAKRMTPDEARELVERHGSQAAAAQACGAPVSTFKHWLNPERHNARRRERYRNDPEWAERERERAYENYHSSSWFERHERQLKSRHRKALKRMEQRNERMERWREE